MKALVACVLLVALAFASTATAGQPATQTLNPPPPSFETCKAVGDGTICAGKRSFEYSQLMNDEGGPAFTCGSGATSFLLVDSGVHEQNAKRIYDGNGNLVERVLHEAFDSTFSNSVTGAAVPYAQHDTITDVLAVPGDFDSVTETVTGLATNVTLPGQGTIFLHAGRTVTFGPDLDLVAEAGPDAYNDWTYDGDVSVWDPVCAALGA